MVIRLRELLLGSPLPSAEERSTRLTNWRALAVLAPDALASVAYANQEIYLGLAVAGAAGLAYSWPLALAIGVLVGLLTLSYSQTIRAYPGGGGSFSVARENLGESAGLVTAAALLSDYVVNAAVSLTAGVAAVTSAWPLLAPHRMALALGLLVLVTLINLRGTRESGTIMTVPVYLFLGVYALMIVWGMVVALRDGPGELSLVAPPATGTLTLFLLLRTFAAGGTALTGIEAISNAVPSFVVPEVKHARQTMLVMACCMAGLFLGTVGLIRYLAIVPAATETVLSALARRVFRNDALYIIVQVVTLLVLVVAANTSFAGFPRVASVLANERLVPRQLNIVGDRLVFSNGIIVLATLSGILIVIFGGDTHALIPLFAVMAFTVFTLSQIGMVSHWLRVKEPRWQPKALANGLGALATGGALLLIAVTKFTSGAWLVFVVVPCLVLVFRGIRGHYQRVADELRLATDYLIPEGWTQPRVVVPVGGIHKGVVEALQYARSISSNVTAIHVELQPGSGARIQQQWQAHHLETLATLAIAPSPYRSLMGPLLEEIDRLDKAADDGHLASVVIAEFVPAHWWHNLLHNQTAWLLKMTLLYRRYRFGKSRAIIDVPMHLRG